MIFLVMLAVNSSVRGLFSLSDVFFFYSTPHVIPQRSLQGKGQIEFGRAVGDTINISREILRGRRDIGFVTAKTTTGDSGSIFIRSNFPSWLPLFKGTNSPSQRWILVLDFPLSCSLIHFLTCKDGVMLLTAGFRLQPLVRPWLWCRTKTQRMWVDGKRTRKKAMKCGVNVDKRVEEGSLILIFSVITHRASVKNEDGYKRESTDCAKANKRWRVPLDFGPLWAASWLCLVCSQFTVFTGKTWFYGSGRGGHSASFFGLCNEMSFWQIYKALIRKGRWGVCYIWSRHHAARDLVSLSCFCQCWKYWKH